MGTLLLLLALSFSHKMSLARDTISSTQSLKYGDTIVSPGGIFEMGFFSPYLCWHMVQFKQMSIRTVVWVANRDTPLTNTSSVALQIINPGRLALVDRNGSEIWSTNTSRSAQNPVAKLLDSGNLVVMDENSENFLWQSFYHPTDTLLAGTNLGKNLVTGVESSLSAWNTETDPSSGQYRMTLDPTGFPQVVFWKGRNKMYRSGPWNGLNWRDLEKWGLFICSSFCNH